MITVIPIVIWDVVGKTPAPAFERSLGTKLLAYRSAPPELRNLLMGAFLTLGRRKFAHFDEIQDAILAEVRQTLNDITEAVKERPIGIALLEQGKSEGIAVGKAEGLHEAIGVLWQQRFGTLPAEVDVQLRLLNADRLLQVLAVDLTHASIRCYAEGL